jgi:cellulose synthase/poly-beta-1,6-N-acetylglucosamine synthase-like glycosyltransferase/peptidoglycan/xylan/chitin deacetylase (PgdA/CDA1 family)/spore germination protein YaaH
LVLGLIAFVGSLWIQPELQLPQRVRDLKTQLRSFEKPVKDYKSMELWTEYSKSTVTGKKRIQSLEKKLQGAAPTNKEIHLGFYAGWDPNSFQSLKSNQESLTHVTTEWFTLRGFYGEVTSDPDPKLLDYLEGQGTGTGAGPRFLPMLTNLSGDEWVPEAVEAILSPNHQRHQVFINEVIRQLGEFPNAGVLIDFQDIDPVYRSALTALLRDLAAKLHEEKKELWLTIPVGHGLRVFDLDALSEFVDRFVAVLHDENSETDDAGPIASQNWFEGWLKVLMGYGNPHQWVVALGNYGYDWTTGKGQAETIAFADIMSRARASKVAKISNQPPTWNGTFTYQDGEVNHEVWFLDALTFANQLKAVREFGVGGAGVFRLGTEDPHLWQVWKKTPEELAQTDPTSLNLLSEESLLSHVGQGEVITVDLQRKPGQRIVRRDASGRFSATYQDYPKYPILFHEGADFPNKVALTFDDGPDSKWTPKVLDLLKEKKVKAAFFVVGNKVEGEPELLQRIHAEGHEIGSHTYTHSNLRLAPREQIILELNATQRLIESVIDRSTILFRPPYQADARPKSIQDLTAIKVAEELGYLTICENIDPEDWAKPGADVILRRVKDQRHSGNIVLLHDAGGDRRQTLEALPKIIDYLRARGDEIVSLSELLQIPRDQLMPSVKDDHHETYRRVSSWGFRLVHTIEELAWAFMVTATGLLLARTLFVAWLAYRHDQRDDAKSKANLLNEKSPDLTPSFPSVSILVPAYNEEKVIQRTLGSLLKNHYPGDLEILVIDDGSKDQTISVVEKWIQTHPQVRLIRQTNQGKSHALQNGMQNAKYEIIVLLDADTQFEGGTIGHLVEPFSEPQVAAVSGQVKVGNSINFLTRCQALEYTCGFNLDRRAYDDLNAITVVPGAVCALRKTHVLEAGGFSHDTLAEDTDLTLMLHRLGYGIRYAPQALAWTEAPESFQGLVKQRIRWSFGTMQCLWKHRDLLFNPEYGWLGWLSLPSIWFFQILLVAIVPIVDSLLILSLILGNGAAVLPFMILFLGVDLFLAVLASRIEHEPISRSVLILPMRLLYRPLLAYVVWKSILRAFSGVWMTWTRVERMGTVDASGK